MTYRDIVWITLDSVRWDHTSFSKHNRETTPHLAKLAVDGCEFDMCFSHDIWTRSSSASILTGQAPSAHQTWTNETKLPRTIATIPEAFVTAGYRTVAISENAQLTQGTGLSRGFEKFHYLNRSTLLKEAGFKNVVKWLINCRRHSGGLTLDGNKHCSGYLSTQLAKQHIDTATLQDEPLFLYIHYNDAHHPYVPPIKWRDYFADDLPMSIDKAINLSLDMNGNLHKYLAQDNPFNKEEWQTLRVLYDTTIAYIDNLTGSIIDHARQNLNDPIIVVTADHGELLGEGGLLSHVLVANTALSNVPLVIYGLDELPNEGLIQHADVMKMLCTDLDIDHAVPLGQDIRKEPRDFVITQSSGERTQNNLKKIREYENTTSEEEFYTEDLTVLRTPEWQYLLSENRTELYAVDESSTDRSEDYPDTAAHLSECCQTWLNTIGQPVAEPESADLDEEMKKQLRDLGYLQS